MTTRRTFVIAAGAALAVANGQTFAQIVRRPVRIGMVTLPIRDPFEPDFHAGMARWYFTEEEHLVWRMKNQYLMTLFETGVLGVVALFALLGAALLAALRAMRAGEPMGAVLAGSISAFAVSSVFNYLLEAPRIATLVYLLCFLALSIAPASKPNQVQA